MFRLYLMFGFNYTEGGPWNDDGIKAIARFVSRVERLVERFNEIKGDAGRNDIASFEKELNYARHFAIRGVTEDADKFQFNTAISRMMELVNALYKYDSDVPQKNLKFMEEVIADLIRLLAPFAPHFTEEMWEQLGYEYSIFNQKWPEWDKNALVKDTIEIAIQVNGTVRSKADVPSNADNSEVEKIALADEKIKPFIDGKEIKKVIIVKNRLVNIVAK